MAEHRITAARVRELFDYDPLTGIFIRKVRLAQRHHVGDRADFLIKKGKLAGYLRVSFDSERVLAHQLAWLYVHGYWPKHWIDHRNAVRSDNRIDNLRDAPPRVNRENQREANRANKSSALGVYWHKELRKWVARINVKGKCCHIGVFDDVPSASAAYVAEKRKLHEGCTI